jgi:hypothetical protein
MNTKICDISFSLIALSGFILTTGHAISLPQWLITVSAIIGAASTGVAKYYKC